MATQVRSDSVFKQPELVKQLVAVNSKFAFDLYSQLRKDSDGQNVFFSPVSISIALAMTYLGAREKTEAEMKQALRLAEMGGNADKAHDAFAELNTILQTGSASSYTLRTANRLFARKSYTFLEDFIKSTRKYYQAESQTLDYAGDADGSRKVINAWVEEQTANKIQELIPTGVIDGNTAMVLVNAIYFKGDWLEKFKPEVTKTEKFKLNEQEEVDVRMMHMYGEKYRYNRSEELDCQVVELPYVGKHLSMLIVLPNKPAGITELEDKLSPEEFNKLTTQMAKVEVNLSVPRFKLEDQFKLNDALSALGMNDLFVAGKADLSGMDGTKKLFASAVVHKSFIEVNEEGSEAAAATAVMIQLMCMPIVMDFHANHPFLFFIRDNRSGGILFMGRLSRPTPA